MTNVNPRLNTQKKIPSCFISYSYDSEDHIEWVVKLAEDLQRSSIETKLDKWDVLPGQDIKKYMLDSITESDYVILVCTPHYVDKAKQKQGGVGQENFIINSDLFDNNFNLSKFITIL